MRKIIVTLVLLVFTLVLSAQALEGIVKDTNTGDFIKDVIVGIEDSKNKNGGKTNAKGHFIFEYKGKFPLTLEFHHPKYQDKSIEVTSLDMEINVVLDTILGSHAIEEISFDINVVDSIPVFPGCEGEVDEKAKMECLNRGLMTVVSENFKYPKEARKKKLSGRVYVNFIIGKKGKVEQAHVIKGEHDVLNKEAVRLIELMPTMKPAYLDGKPVRMQYTIPLNFKLE